MGWDAGYVAFGRNDREALKAHLMSEYTYECQDGARWVAESISLKSNVAHILARYVPAGADVETLGDCAPYLFTVLIRWEGADLATKGIGCDPGNSTVPKKFIKTLYDSIIQGNPKLSDWETEWIIEEREARQTPTPQATIVAIPGSEFGYNNDTTVIVKKNHVGFTRTGKRKFRWQVIEHNTPGAILGCCLSGSRSVKRWVRDENIQARLKEFSV